MLDDPRCDLVVGSEDCGLLKTIVRNYLDLEQSVNLRFGLWIIRDYRGDEQDGRYAYVILKDKFRTFVQPSDQTSAQLGESRKHKQ